jgi:hypothetical protein
VRSTVADGLGALFVSDPVAAVLRVLRRDPGALTAVGIKEALLGGGVGKSEADRQWPGIQRRLRCHENVVVAGTGHLMTYRWIEKSSDPTPMDALEQLANGQMASTRRRTLADIVRAALTGSSSAVVSRLEQKEKDAVRALAELAMEVEELATNEASAKAMIHRVRARTKLAALEPIGRAGEVTTFDRKRHESVGRSVHDGSTVVVVRPGYLWKGELLLAKAVVQDRS